MLTMLDCFLERGKDIARGMLNKPSTLPDGTCVYTAPCLGLRFSLDRPVGLGYILGTYEPEVIQAMRSHVVCGDTVLDIGAHAGYLTAQLSSLVGTAGRVYSFEPTPSSFRILQRNIFDNRLRNVIPLPFAVARSCGPAKLLVDPSSYENRLVEDAGDSDILPVQTVTVDEIVSANSLKVSFMKIDVEGAELDVLLGARQVLDTFQPVVVAEVRDRCKDAVYDVMDKYHYSGKVISRIDSDHLRRGTPNILFNPR